MAKTVGSIDLLAAPASLVLHLSVLMFVPSKLDWTERFHGMQIGTWTVVLAAAAITHLANSVAGWAIGSRLF